MVVIVGAVVLGVVFGRLAQGVTAMLAAAMAMLTGAAGAYGCHTLRELRSGAVVVDARFANLPTLLGEDRLTLVETRASIGARAGRRFTESIVIHCMRMGRGRV